MINNNESLLDARASISGYIIFCGMFSLMGVLILITATVKNNLDINAIIMSGLFFFGAGLWALWLKGHRIQICNNLITYRDGLYKVRQAGLDEIKSVKHAWIHYQYLWRKLEMPRLAIRLTDQNIPPILINAKPFSRVDLEMLEKIISQHGDVSNEVHLI